jgi:alanine racemase
MARSLFTIDLAAVRHNARLLRGVLGRSELWAVVKADGYGHGAGDVGRVALAEGATALCVATVGEALVLRALLPQARLVVMGPTSVEELPALREAGLELCVSRTPLPEGIPLHLKLDTGMGRWGLSELPAPTRDVVGLMSHFASGDSDEAFTSAQLARFLEATAAHGHLTRHIANSAGALRYPAARLDAARCGIALYGISPFATDPAADGLRPALRWVSEVALVQTLAPGESTGYGRRFVAERPTRIGIVPIGYADGFRRDMTGTEVLVADTRVRVLGAVSMDALAIELPHGVEPGAPVTLIGDGVLVEQHARVSGTIGYEIACGLVTRPPRAQREVVDA